MLWCVERGAAGGRPTVAGSRDAVAALRGVHPFEAGAGHYPVGGGVQAVGGLPAGKAMVLEQPSVDGAGEDRREAPEPLPGAAVAGLDLASVPGEALGA